MVARPRPLGPRPARRPRPRTSSNPASPAECGHDEPRLVPGEPEHLRNLFVRDNRVGSHALVNLTPSGVVWPEPEEARPALLARLASRRLRRPRPRRLRRGTGPDPGRADRLPGRRRTLRVDRRGGPAGDRPARRDARARLAGRGDQELRRRVGPSSDATPQHRAVPPRRLRRRLPHLLRSPRRRRRRGPLPARRRRTHRADRRGPGGAPGSERRRRLPGRQRRRLASLLHRRWNS